MTREQFKPVACLLLVIMFGCMQNFSNGERVGVVTKISEKGVFYKSWEAEALIALSAGTSMVQPEKFVFTVDPAAVEKVKQSAEKGTRVRLIYRQWAIAPPSIDTKYVVYDVKETDPAKGE